MYYILVIVIFKNILLDSILSEDMFTVGEIVNLYENNTNLAVIFDDNSISYQANSTYEDTLN